MAKALSAPKSRSAGSASGISPNLLAAAAAGLAAAWHIPELAHRIPGI